MPTYRAGHDAIPGWVAGLYYGNDTQNAVSNYSAATIGGLNTYAVWCATPGGGVRIDRIGAEITTISAGKTFRVGAAYPDGARGRPGALIVDSGPLSAGATGFVEATVDVHLPGDGVWLLIHAEDSTMQFRIIGATTRVALVGRAVGGGTGGYGSIAISRTFQALPDPWPGGDAPATNCPVIQVRAA